MTPARHEPAAPRSRVKHSTIEPLRSCKKKMFSSRNVFFAQQPSYLQYNTVISEIFARVLFSRNFYDAEFLENKIPAKQ